MCRVRQKSMWNHYVQSPPGAVKSIRHVPVVTMRRHLPITPLRRKDSTRNDFSPFHTVVRFGFKSICEKTAAATKLVFAFDDKGTTPVRQPHEVDSGERHGCSPGGDNPTIRRAVCSARCHIIEVLQRGGSMTSANTRLERHP